MRHYLLENVWSTTFDLWPFWMILNISWWLAITYFPLYDHPKANCLSPNPYIFDVLLSNFSLSSPIIYPRAKCWGPNPYIFNAPPAALYFFPFLLQFSPTAKYLGPNPYIFKGKRPSKYFVANHQDMLTIQKVQRLRSKSFSRGVGLLDPLENIWIFMTFDDPWYSVRLFGAEHWAPGFVIRRVPEPE